MDKGMPPLASIEYFSHIMYLCRKDRFPHYTLCLSEHMRKSGLEAHLSLCNCLVLMLLEVGSVCNARQVIDKFGFWDDYLRNAVISGYAKIEALPHAFDLYHMVKENDILCITSYTFVALLKSCTKMKDVKRGHKLHADIAKLGLLETDVFISSTLIDMYVKFDLLTKAQEVFDKLLVWNVVAWTALMDGYADKGHSMEVLIYFEQMQEKNVSLDRFTYVCILKACGNLKEIDKGREMHIEIAKKGMLEEDAFVGSTVVDMYSKCGMLAEAQQAFDKLPIQDVVSWTALITGYADHGRGEDALDSFRQMRQQGISPNAFTFVSSLSACGSIGITGRGREIHGHVAKVGLEREPIISNSLIDMFVKCGSLAEAQVMFDCSPVHDVVSWTTLITGYAQIGEVSNVFHTFDRMIREGVKPDVLTFRIILNACSHTGLLDMAQVYFSALSSYYDFIPTLHHYNCIIDLLGRAGHIDKAVTIMENMPLHPGVVMWHTVLGACRQWDDVELGKHAFKHAVHLDEEDAGAFVCMSNIYAGAGSDSG